MSNDAFAFVGETIGCFFFVIILIGIVIAIAAFSAGAAWGG